jgi:Peptidase S46
MPGRCSASLISDQGLVLTNHHCVVECLEQLSTAAKNYLATPFVATRLEEEVRCPGIELNQLTSIADVTDQIRAADSKPAPMISSQSRSTNSRSSRGLIHTRDCGLLLTNCGATPFVPRSSGSAIRSAARWPAMAPAGAPWSPRTPVLRHAMLISLELQRIRKAFHCAYPYYFGGLGGAKFRRHQPYLGGPQLPPGRA